ncbi:MAG: ABC transporter substrate-binding protein [Treponema sp.]|nr:ABC transporter substrate-binding protein [Treponema sp.]MBD5407230.1 ABC transporter substrate-binding protein [Treponema sp.]MBD5409017.1 ABC transporter substrate-binding protein [Treponema sp.]MBD5442083.1 ABC transporter substrate-binding protein [Treponema sp.]MDE6245068.1 ABC transporter substrate-binding protein [Treponemataceae bacterium]
MKKILSFMMVAVMTCAFFSGCKKSEKTKIGIAKIVQHIALDDIERGVIDVVKEAGIDAEFDLQNANGDVGTAAQIASQFKAEKVDVAVGIATPIALALANTLKEIPVVFGTVTDPLGAGLVTTLEHGEGNVTGMSDAIPTDQHIRLFAEVAGIKTLGYIYTSNEDNSSSSLELVKKGCEEAGIALVTQSITKSDEVKQAAEAIVNRVDGVYLSTDNTVFSAISALVDVFGKAKKPIFSGDVTAAREGGIFIASGFNYYKAGRATGEMVVAILQGALPSEMPIRFMTEPSDSDFLIDLDVAAHCGIALSDELIDSANLIFQNGVLTEK